MKKKIDFTTIVNPSTPEYEIFHELTKNKRLAKNKSAKYWPKEFKTIYYKGYERMKEIQLPKPALLNTSLKKIMCTRKSTRTFLSKPLSLQELSTLFFFSAGINKNLKNRFYPSAGARYPLEVYLLTTNSELNPGLYHYYVKNNSLEELLCFKKFNYKKYFVDKWVENAGNIIIITSIFKRSTIKYGMKGYRHALLESGHMAQNIYLLSSSLKLSCCETSGFFDDRLHKLLDIDGKMEAILTTITVGNKEN